VPRVCHGHKNRGLHTHQGAKQASHFIYALNRNIYLFLKPDFRVVLFFVCVLVSVLKVGAAQAGRLCLFISCQTQLNEIHRKMLVR